MLHMRAIHRLKITLTFIIGPLINISILIAAIEVLKRLTISMYRHSFSLSIRIRETVCCLCGLLHAEFELIIYLEN